MIVEEKKYNDYIKQKEIIKDIINIGNILKDDNNSLNADLYTNKIKKYVDNKLTESKLTFKKFIIENNNNDGKKTVKISTEEYEHLILVNHVIKHIYYIHGTDIKFINNDRYAFAILRIVGSIDI
jgi:hypothetical protein